MCECVLLFMLWSLSLFCVVLVLKKSNCWCWREAHFVGVVGCVVVVASRECQSSNLYIFLCCVVGVVVVLCCCGFCFVCVVFFFIGAEK